MDYRRQLEQQLAEVAAGRRERVDNTLRAEVNREESLLEAERRAANESMSRTALAAEETARQTREAKVNGERQLRDAKRHHIALEEFSRRQLQLHEVASEQLRLHQEKLVELEAARNCLAEQQHAVNLLRDSPSYAAAVLLRKYISLATPHEEMRQVGRLVREILPVAKEFECALAESDARFLTAERDEALRQLHEKIEELSIQLATVREAPKDGRSMWNPAAWLGKSARLGEQQSRGAALKLQLEQAKTERDGLVMADGGTSSTSEATRRARVKALARRLRIQERRDEVCSRLIDWIKATRRYVHIEMWFGLRLPRQPAFETIDPLLCANLDQALAQGASTVSYPGLGVLPLGQSFASMLEEVAYLEVQPEAIEGLVDLEGSEELTALAQACVLGVYDKGRHSAGIKREYLLAEGTHQPKMKFGLGGEERDELFADAILYVANKRLFDREQLQQHFKIDEARARLLLDVLVSESLLEALGSQGGAYLFK